MSFELTTIPPIGNLQAYIYAVNQYPTLSPQEEQEAARKLRSENCMQSAAKLVLSHLRLVVSLARKYSGYEVPQEELIQEGNIGLMKAVKRFDPDVGVRLVTYAIPYIKNEMNEYVIKNAYPGKVATTHVQRKLFFNLRSMYKELRANPDLSQEDIRVEIARRCNCSVDDVREMQKRLINTTIVIDERSTASSEGYFEEAGDVQHQFQADDEAYEPSLILERLQREELLERIRGQIDLLSERERYIIEERWLNTFNEEVEKKTLQELGVELGVSTERVRQIESAALKKIRKALAQ